MCWFRKSMSAVVFSPVLLIISMFLLFSNLRQKQCRKHLFLNLSLKVLDSLNIHEFCRIVSIMLQSQHFKITKPIQICSNEQVLIAYKNKIKVLVTVTNNPFVANSDLVLKAHNDRQCFGCDEAVIISNCNFSNCVVNEAIKLNVKLICRNDLDCFLKKDKKTRIAIRNLGKQMQ